MSSETTVPTIYEIPARNLAGLMFKIAKLSKKSEKLINKPITLTMMGEIRRPKLHPLTGRKMFTLDGAQITEVFHQVTISAEIPRIAGWTFIATIDHSPSTGNLLRIVPNTVQSLPAKYRTIGPLCDHCQKIRSRRDTYLLRNDNTGELKQIGATCVRVFIGYDPKQAVMLAQWVTAAVPADSDGDSDEPSMGMVDRRYIAVATFLAHVAAMIRTNGWTSRKDVELTGGQSTSSQALFNMFPMRANRNALVEITDRDLKLADEALAWGQTIAVAKNGDRNYLDNLRTLSFETMIEGRSIGLLASLIPAYQRATERALQRAAQRRASYTGSQHVGKVGDRLRNLPVTMMGYISREGKFGVWHRYRFVDAAGNVFIWFASGDMKLVQGCTVTLTGTVKKHDTRENEAQTLLTRCKVVPAN